MGDEGDTTSPTTTLRQIDRRTGVGSWPHRDPTSPVPEMKKAGCLAASLAATAATSAVVASNSDDHHQRRYAAPSSSPSSVSSDPRRASPNSSSRRDGDGEGKFAPRFDGLRFIETLVTAHR